LIDLALACTDITQSASKHSYLPVMVLVQKTVQKNNNKTSAFLQLIQAITTVTSKYS